ncbi:MAG TPA: polysaccharide deacetylase family protein [Acidobacteriaceae bacterium]|nr:polysaccharide deacetylase family protein [Acidobacteriaceae bacterium]
MAFGLVGAARAQAAHPPHEKAKTKAPKQIAVTFDDLPVHGPLPPGETRLEVAQRVIQALKAAHMPPTYGFVNGQRVEDHPTTVDVLAAWRKAGYPLGNHTWSHMNLDQVPLQNFEGDIAKDEPLLRLQMNGADWHWFRFPYLAEGNTIEKKAGIRVYLAQHGYKIAGVTMSFADYDWNEPYARCSERHDAAKIVWLEHSYLQAAEDDIVFRHTMAEKVFGHDIPYVLLMHIGAFDARMLPRLLAMYKRDGFAFISLEDAEKDPFYRFDVDPRLLPGPDSLESAMEEKHLPLPKHMNYGPDLEKTCR